MNILKITLIFFLYIGSFTVSSEERSNFILYAEAIADRDDVEVRINDIPVGIAGSNKLFSRMIEDYLLPKENTLSLHALDTDSRGKARIAAYKEGELLDGKAGRTFIHTHLTSTKKMSLVEGELAPERTLWSWFHNKPLNKSNEEDAIEAARSIYRNLVDANTEKLILSLTPYLSEVGSTYSKTTEKQRVDDFVNTINRIKSKDIWSFDKIDEIKITLVPVANGKMFELRRDDGSPLLRTNQETRKEWFSIGNMMGLQNGEWFIFR